jgi:hypothetical protein
VSDVAVAEWAAHIGDDVAQQAPVPQDRSDILEQNAGLGVVGYGAQALPNPVGNRRHQVT